MAVIDNQQLQSGAAQPDSPDQPDGPVVKVPLADDGPNTLEQWKQRITASKQLIDDVKDDWEANQQRYLVKAPTKKGREAVVVPKDYANVEQKKALLFFQQPDVQLEPLLPGLEAAVPTFEAVLNHYLGPKGVNSMAMVTEVLSDALCPSGVFASKISYESTIDGTKQVQIGQEPDPTAPPAPQMPGSVLGIPQQPMRPIMADVPNVIAETYRWDRIDPLKLLLPNEFKGSDYDRASYLGHEFVMDGPVAKRVFNLPDSFNSYITVDDRVLGKDITKGGAEKGGNATAQRVRGWEIWYRASAYDATVVHPERIRLLVLIEGLDQPVRHEDSPFQTINPDGTVGGMKGYPIHVGALRFVSGTALPPSDCQMSRHIVDELSEGRTQMKLQRKRNIPLRFADLGRIGGEQGLAKIERGIYQGVIGLESIDPNNPPVIEARSARFPPESFEFDGVGNRDLAQAWALDLNQTGVQNDKVQTATEASIQQQNSNVRLDAERTRFLNWYVAGVEKLGALIQMFATDQSYIRIAGPDGQARLQQWDKKSIEGQFVYKAKPNSSKRIDATVERSQFLQVYNLLAPSPFVNHMELITQLVKKFDLDPSKLINQPQPKPADVPKVSYAFKGEDLIPTAPQFPIIVEILRQGGIAIDDQAIQQAQGVAIRQGAPADVIAGAVSHGPATPPPPGGAPAPSAQASNPVNKHAMERTGQQPGPKVGAPAGVGPR